MVMQRHGHDAQKKTKERKEDNNFYPSLMHRLITPHAIHQLRETLSLILKACQQGY